MTPRGSQHVKIKIRIVSFDLHVLLFTVGCAGCAGNCYHLLILRVFQELEMDIDGEEGTPQTHTVQARFVSDVGVEAGPPLDLPVSVTKEQLELILNALLKNVTIGLST